MGYDTTFTGEFTVSGEYEDDIEVFNDLLDLRFTEEEQKKIGVNTHYCDWRFCYSFDGSTCLAWNGSEKSYDMFEWLSYIKATILEPNDLVLNGIVIAHGEEPSDIWRIVAKDNEFVREKGKMVFEPA